MSAEERLAALLHVTLLHNPIGGVDDSLARMSCEQNGDGGRCRRWAETLAAAGVSVPTEPGAPDLVWQALKEWAEAVTAQRSLVEAADAEFAATGTDYFDNSANYDRAEAIEQRVSAAEDALLAAEDGRASQPVPAPEPSARLDVEAVYRSFANTIRPTGTLGRSRTRRGAVGTAEAVQHLRRVIDEMGAATPQDPEA